MSFRREFITKPIFSWARGVLPPMSGVVYSCGEMNLHLGEMKRASPRSLMCRACSPQITFFCGEGRGILLV